MRRSTGDTAMKTYRIALVCVTGALLAGCSSMDTRDTFVPPQRAPSIMDPTPHTSRTWSALRGVAGSM